MLLPLLFQLLEIYSGFFGDGRFRLLLVNVALLFSSKLATADGFSNGVDTEEMSVCTSLSMAISFLVLLSV